MGVFCATRLRFGTDITNFLPTEKGAQLAKFSKALADTPATRTMVVSIGADDVAAAVAAARALAEGLRDHPEVASLRSGLAADQLRQLYELYFPRRYAFFSEAPEREWPALLSETALRARARELKQQLAAPTSTFLDRLAARDPLAAFARILGRVRGAEGALALHDGHFVSQDGFAIFFLTTRSSAFASEPQAQLLDDLRDHFAAIAAESEAKLVLELAGMNRFSVAAERSIRRDVPLIAGVSFAGIAALFLLFFRSPSLFGWAILPSLFGIFAALSLGLLLFGNLDGLVIGFGASLLGAAIDYTIHLLTHHALGAETSLAAVARRLRPPLVLGAGTTMASFAGLLFTSFPGIQQIGFFSVVGIGVALLATLWFLPVLLPAKRRVPAFSRMVAFKLGAGIEALLARRRLLFFLCAAVVLLSSAALPRLRWVDNLQELWGFDPALLSEEERVRARVSHFDTGRAVIALGSDAEAALQKNLEVRQKLAALVEAGDLESARSLADFLWPVSLQRRNQTVLAAQPQLAERVEAAFVAEGFRPTALAQWKEELTKPAPPPLTLADLAASPLRDLVAPFVFPVGERVAAVTYLQGVKSADNVRAALVDLDEVFLFEQRVFIDELYQKFRNTTLEQMFIGSLLVLLVLFWRYRRWRPALAAFLPSLLVAICVLGCLAAAGVGVNLLHVMSLLMVTGMGVDYGIFLVDSAHDRRSFASTALSLLLACLTTVFSFGALALSSHPFLRSIGVATGLGVLLSFVFAPVAYGVAGAYKAPAAPERASAE